VPGSEITAQSDADADHELIDALVMTSFGTMAVLNRVAAEHDLSLTQLRVLAILRDGPTQMTDLVGYLGLDKSTVSGLVDRAERRGLVLRVPSARDGRRIDVMLSEAGSTLAQRGATEVARSLSGMTGALSPAESRRLTTLLHRMLGRAV
jgi:DNA-binding MarR family transcriptional regulator